LRKSLRGLRFLSEKEPEAIDAMTRAIIKKVLHQPIASLKEKNRNSDGHRYATAIRNLFGIEAEAEALDQIDSDASS
jgi:glutamyl-tRNA reductase